MNAVFILEIEVIIPNSSMSLILVGFNCEGDSIIKKKCKNKYYFLYALNMAHQPADFISVYITIMALGLWTW